MDLRQLVEHLSSVRDNVSVRDNINVYETLKNQVLGGFKIFCPKLLMRKKKIIISMNSLELLEQVLDLKKITIL